MPSVALAFFLICAGLALLGFSAAAMLGRLEYVSNAVDVAGHKAIERLSKLLQADATHN